MGEKSADRWYFLRSKTFWTGISMAFTGVFSWVSGVMDQAAAMALVGNGLGLIFLRDAVAKK